MLAAVNPNALRALAVLCLLCVLPKLGATVLTITQTAAGTNAGDYGFGNSASVGLEFAPFDARLGTLTGVSLTYSFQVSVSISEFNPFDTPMIIGPAIIGTARAFAIHDGELASNFLSAEYARRDPIVELAPGRTHGISETFNFLWADSLTGPALNAFIGGGGIRTTVSSTLGVRGGYGSTNHTINVTTTLEYRYTVPDSGTTLLTLSLTLTLLLGFHSLRNHQRVNGQLVDRRIYCPAAL